MVDSTVLAVCRGVFLALLLMVAIDRASEVAVEYVRLEHKCESVGL
jgi:hypothetical protein